jgi:hypothetical protein
MQGYMQVLENYHVASTFRLLKGRDCNFIRALTRNDYLKFRKLVIVLILATGSLLPVFLLSACMNVCVFYPTDLSQHVHLIKKTKEYFQLKDANTSRSGRGLSSILEGNEADTEAQVG